MCFSLARKVERGYWKEGSFNGRQKYKKEVLSVAFIIKILNNKLTNVVTIAIIK